VLVNPLEPSDDHDATGTQVRHDARTIDVAYPRLVVGAVGQDADLTAGVRARRAPDMFQGHAQQGDGHLLAGRQQHVELSGGRFLLDGPGQTDEPVRLARHRGDDHDHPVTAFPPPLHPLGHSVDALDAADGRSAILLHDQRHGNCSCPR